MKKRCDWPTGDSLMITYHDEEWGVPVHNDKILFEYFLLDTFQAGLSWRTILHKRDNFRAAFSNFDYKEVAKYSQKDALRLMGDAGIVRNRLKIAAAINNAQKFQDIQKEFGSFDKYIWQFVEGKPKINKFTKLSQLPANTRDSDAMSKDLKTRGFGFVGSTICYAFMQGAGLVNDHLTHCFRHKEVGIKSS